jgi:hypothetical protein
MVALEHHDSDAVNLRNRRHRQNFCRAWPSAILWLANCPQRKLVPLLLSLNHIVTFERFQFGCAYPQQFAVDPLIVITDAGGAAPDFAWGQ